ncbi:MAG: glycoside hydrolase family 172 protein [Planctomycetota bacterium]
MATQSLLAGAALGALALACQEVPRRPPALDGALDHLLSLQDGRSRRATSTRALPDGRPDADSNYDNFRVAPGATHVLADLAGPGIIRHLWITFLGPEPQPWAPAGAASHKDMILRIFWDGRAEPGVEAPVGDFFASGFGERMAVTSIPVLVEKGASYNCFWPMPFAKSARIEIENDSEKEIALLYYNIDWIEKDSLPPDTPYFHAQYKQEYPLAAGSGDYEIFAGEGRGHYVGTFLSVRSRSPGWFGEGDEKMWIDGEAEPSIWGTGTEDYFLCAWGLHQGCYPYFGVPLTDGGFTLGGKTCSYRWHLPDPIAFRSSLRVAIERMGWIARDENPRNEDSSWNERQDDYASVATWYQIGEPKRFARVPTPAAARRLPPIDVVVRGADLVATGRRGAGEAMVQSGELWTDGAQMLYRPPAPDGAWVEIPFEVDRKRPLRLVLALTTSYDFGIYDALLDGVPVATGVDLYTPETAVREFPLLDLWPAAGPHVLRLECTGQNPLSKGAWLGLDSLRLRERRPRVEEYGWDRDKDWRTERILY